MDAAAAESAVKLAAQSAAEYATESGAESAKERATDARSGRAGRLQSVLSERSDGGNQMWRTEGSRFGEGSNSSSSSASGDTAGGSGDFGGGGDAGGGGGRRPGLGYLRSTRELQSDAGDGGSTVDMDFEVVLTTEAGEDFDSASSRVALVVEDYADGGRKELADALGVLPSEVRWVARVGDKCRRRHRTPRERSA